MIQGKRTKRSDQSTPAPRKRGLTPANTLSLLKSFIQEGSYAPGMVLPTERALAEKLGVGRPAIRESIKALTILDVLESRRGDGTYLKSLDGLRRGWPATVDLRSRDFSVLDLLEVRKMVEPKAAKLAAARATEPQLRRIEDEYIRSQEAKDWRHAAEHDLLLHTAIIEAAGNPVLTELNSALTRLLHRSRQMSAARAPDRDQMNRSHTRVVDAILKGDGDEAEEAMLDHLHRVGLDLISNRKR
jgi:GntR family transcriptional repressor for pyruvate dehydrogenase complex